MTRPRDQRGVAVVVGIATTAVLVVVAAVSVGVVSIVLAHRRAQVAADHASLAGATALQQGADPCDRAAAIAHRHRTELTSCVIEGTSVVVATSVALLPMLGGADVPARARAGPAGPTTSALP